MARRKRGPGLKAIKKVGPGVKPKGTFAALRAKLAGKKGIFSPGGLAAAIGRKKFGAKRFARMSAAGRKKQKS